MNTGSRAIHFCNGIPEKNNLREHLLWFAVSEVSVHGPLTLLFLGCGEKTSWKEQVKQRDDRER